MTHRRSRRLVAAAAALFLAGPARTNERKFGMNVPGTDDRQFGLNLVRWLSRLLN